MKRIKNVDAMAEETGVNAFGIPTDPDAAIKAVADGTIKFTEDPDSVLEGPVIEGYSIKAKGEDDVVLYEQKNQPFGYMKVGGIQGVFANYEGKGVKVGEAALTDDQVKFLESAFPGEKQGAVISYLVSLHNANERDKAKGSDYQRVLGLKKPLSEEDKGKAFEAAVRNTVRSSGLPEAMVRTMLRTAIDNAAKEAK